MVEVEVEVEVVVGVVVGVVVVVVVVVVVEVEVEVGVGVVVEVEVEVEVVVGVGVGVVLKGEIMKKLIEVENGGLLSLLDENVLIFCVNYIYTGKLTGVNDDCIQLSDAKIVYETGDFQTPGFKDAQALPTSEWFVRMSAIESFGRAK